MEDEKRERIGGHTVELSNLNKVFFPESGITKGDVIEYYRRVAGTMLPHVRDRVISMERWPDGIQGEGFYHKEVPDYFPSWIHTATVEKADGSNRQVIIDDAATLVYLADQACLTPHVWLSRFRSLRRPDRLVFDLDPPDPWEIAFDDVRWAARLIRDLLADLGLPSGVMTSGSRGLHVYVVLDAKAEFNEVKHFARSVAELLAHRHPQRLTTEVRKDRRGSRIFIDYLRNAYAQTTVAPYAIRARPGAPVATPLDWDELSSSGLGPRTYTLENLFRRLGQKHDPWAGLGEQPSGLAAAREALDREISS